MTEKLNTLRCPLHYRTQNLQITKEYTLLTLNIHNLFILYYLKRLKRTASLKSCDKKKKKEREREREKLKI